MPGGQAFRGAGAARDPSTWRGTRIPRTRGSLRRKTQRAMPPGAAEPVCGPPTASQMLARPGNAPSGWRAWQRGLLEAGALGVSLAEVGEEGRCQDNFIVEMCHPQSLSDPSSSRLQDPPLWPALQSPSTSPASWPRFPACRSPWAHVDLSSGITFPVPNSQTETPRAVPVLLPASSFSCIQTLPTLLMVTDTQGLAWEAQCPQPGPPLPPCLLIAQGLLTAWRLVLPRKLE